MSEHELTTRHETDGHGRDVYTAVCTCGWESQPMIFQFEATREAHDHEANPT